MNSLKQAFSWWAFANRGIDSRDLLAGAAQIGYDGVDLIEEALWPLAQNFGLIISAMGGHGTIQSGLNDPANARRIEDEVLHNLAKAETWNIPHLICFSGNRGSCSDEEALEVCASTLARVAARAEAAGVTLVVELLNSKVDHPCYQCDHTAWGVKLCQAVNSPAVRLLYDIYHMQIMEGDIIRTIQEHQAWFGYYHTAGNPGRRLPDTNQELNYPAIYQAIRATNYRGWISHEFLPRGNPLEELGVAFRDCAAGKTADPATAGSLSR